MCANQTFISLTDSSWSASARVLRPGLSSLLEKSERETMATAGGVERDGLTDKVAVVLWTSEFISQSLNVLLYQGRRKRERGEGGSSDESINSQDEVLYIQLPYKHKMLLDIEVL